MLSSGRYLLNRFARIFPLYFILTTATFIVALRGHHLPLWPVAKVYLLNITLLKGYFAKFKFSGIGPGWSLSVEELFYLLAPLFFLLIRRSMRFLWILPLCLLITGFASVRLLGFGMYRSLLANDSLMLLGTLFGRSSEFFIGMWLAVSIHKGKPVFRSGALTYPALCLIILTLCLMTLIGRGGYGFVSPAGMAINSVFLPLCIIMFFQGLLTEKTIVQSILSSRPFTRLGKSSYAFYLIHVSIIANVFLRAKSFILFFILLQATAIILWKFVEEPLSRAIRKLSPPEQEKTTDDVD